MPAIARDRSETWNKANMGLNLSHLRQLQAARGSRVSCGGVCSQTPLSLSKKGVQTPEPSETEADSQLGSEPINDAINEAKDKKDDEENEKMLRKTSTAQRRITMRKLIRTVLMKALMVHKKAIRRKIRRKRTRRRSLRTFFFRDFLCFLVFLARC